MRADENWSSKSTRFLPVKNNLWYESFGKGVRGGDCTVAQYTSVDHLRSWPTRYLSILALFAGRIWNEVKI